ncbi:hypothetical protein N9C56_08960 [Paracoccaceae bacterium]|nr:hypothetical protein [Paracoccaceae bacterium]
MTDREEMRRLIDVIEKSANNSSLTQVIDDIRLFYNTASFLANKLDTRLRNKDVAKKRAAPKATKTVGLRKPTMPKTLNVPNKPEPNSQAPTVTAVSQADFERLKPQKPQSAL